MSEVDRATFPRQAPISDLEEIIMRAEGDLLLLRGSRIFITGGTGYIGKWLLECLCSANRELNLGLKVFVLSRNKTRFMRDFPHLGCDFTVDLIQGDVREFNLDVEGITHVIHAATDVVAVNPPLDVFDVTIDGTKRVLEYCRKMQVHSTLLLSSGAVYGTFPSHLDCAHESMSCVLDFEKPGTAYGLGKIASEWLANTYSKEYGVRCKTARIFAQVGPYLPLDAQFAAGNFIRDVLESKSIVIKGDGMSLRSYMYPTDLIAWLIKILINGQPGRAYNVGSDDRVSIKGLAEEVLKVMQNNKLGIKVLGIPSPGMAPEVYLPDISRAQTELGLSIEVSLEDSLKRTIDWYRQQK